MVCPQAAALLRRRWNWAGRSKRLTRCITAAEQVAAPIKIAINAKVVMFVSSNRIFVRFVELIINRTSVLVNRKSNKISNFSKSAVIIGSIFLILLIKNSKKAYSLAIWTV